MTPLVPAQLTIGVALQPQTPIVDGWRCLHMAEGGYPNPLNMPEVRPSANARPILFTRDMQLLSFELANRVNPLIGGKQWAGVYGNWTAFTNGNGFGNDADPRADYVNGVNLSSPLPKLMKAIICGGMFLTGIVDGGNLVCVPGVHGIDANGPMPSVDEVLRRHWYFHAVTLHKTPESLGHFPQGLGGPVLVPYFLREPTPYPLAWFERWVGYELPDPLRIYRR